MIDLADTEESKLKQAKSADVYDLGLCLLLAIVGDNVLLLENFMDFYADQKESNQNNYEFCFNSLIDWLDSREQEMIDDKNLSENKITLRKILYSNRITENLRMFLIECLRFDQNERNTADVLLKHPWLSETNKYNPNECLVSLPEMIRAQNNLNKTETS